MVNTHTNEFKNICDCINLQGVAAPTHCPLNHVVWFVIW